MENKLNKFPKIFGALLLVILVLVIQIISIIIAAILNVSSTALTTPMASGILSLVSIGIVISIGLKKNGISFTEQFSFRPFKLSLVLPMVVTIFGLSILLSDVDNLTNLILPMPPSFRNFFTDLFTDPWGLLSLVLVAPIAEELLFRGLILDSFLTNYKIKTSIIASSILFGLVHFNPWQFVGPIVIGIVLAWWYVETKSLLFCMLGHAVNNAIPKLLSLSNIDIPGYTVSYPGKVIFQPLWFDIVGLILFMLGTLVLYKMFKKNKCQHDIA